MTRIGFKFNHHSRDYYNNIGIIGVFGEFERSTESQENFLIIIIKEG